MLRFMRPEGPQCGYVSNTEQYVHRSQPSTGNTLRIVAEQLFTVVHTRRPMGRERTDLTVVHIPHTREEGITVLNTLYPPQGRGNNSVEHSFLTSGKRE